MVGDCIVANDVLSQLASIWRALGSRLRVQNGPIQTGSPGVASQLSRLGCPLMPLATRSGHLDMPGHLDMQG
jgi:hypothetical protein